MDTIDRAENDRDDAAAELRALKDKLVDVEMEVRLVLINAGLLTEETGRCVDDYLTPLFADIAFEEITEIESRLSEAQDALSHAESLDERRSAPVVI